MIEKNSYLTFEKEHFLLLKESKKLFYYSDNYIYENFPRNKRHLKIQYMNYLNSLLENIILANYSDGSIKKKYQKNCLLYVSLLDFQLSYFFDIKLIEKKRYLSSIKILSNVKALLMGWINAEK